VDLNTMNFNKAISAGKAITQPQLLFWPEIPVSNASGLLDAVTRPFGEIERNRPRLLLSPAILSSGLTASAAKAQTVINFPGGFTGATGYITLDNPLVGGSIHLIPSRCGWTF
jgi:hypothetical protein